MDFHDNPCPWAWKNPKKNAGAMTCLGGVCIEYPNRCIRKRDHVAAQPEKPFKPRGAKKR